jgi:hypothetical protein
MPVFPPVMIMTWPVRSGMWSTLRDLDKHIGSKEWEEKYTPEARLRGEHQPPETHVDIKFAVASR